MNAIRRKDGAVEATLDGRQYRLTFREGQPVMLHRLHVPCVNGRMTTEVWQRIWPVNGPHGGKVGHKVAPILDALLQAQAMPPQK